MQDFVFSYPKLKNRLATCENPKEDKEKVLEHLKEIRSQFSHRHTKAFVSFLDAVLPQLYDGVDFNDNEVHLKELIKDKCVVLVPNHQSHADYLTINYRFFKDFNTPLYVAGGNNLNIPVIGPLFRKMGCFFIRRSFQNDILYKITLEAYLYYLMKKRRSIEFFFEGGRSRTGKLRSPRFGLFNMLLEVHKELLQSEDLELVFVPVSIVHEYIPETSSLAKELSGKKKKKESFSQLFKLFGLFAYQFGTVQIRLGRPIKRDVSHDKSLKDESRELAFKCFREVGRNMMVTPSSLLALILLDNPSGAMAWQDIIHKAKLILKYCRTFDVPLTESLKPEKVEKSLERAMDILIGNKRVDVIGREHHGSLFYNIHDEYRGEILHSKNTILHHFLVPTIMSQVWVNIFSGKINSSEELKEFFLKRRNELKYEFYLPTVMQFFYRSLNLVSESLGRKVTKLDDFINFNREELYKIASDIGIFSRSLSYIFEGYYCCALAIKSLSKISPEGFSEEDYVKKTRAIFDEEITLGNIIRYKEAYSPLIVTNAFKFFQNEEFILKNENLYSIKNEDEFTQFLERSKQSLKDQRIVNIQGIE